MEVGRPERRAHRELVVAWARVLSGRSDDRRWVGSDDSVEKATELAAWGEGDKHVGDDSQLSGLTKRVNHGPVC